MQRMNLKAAAIVSGLVVGLIPVEMGAWYYKNYLDLHHRQTRMFREKFPTDHALYRGRMPFVFRPGAEGRYAGVPVRINSEGFRDREVGRRQEGDLRIAVIGNSIVFGHGVREEDTLSSLLSSNLNGSRSGGHFRTRVHNFGIPGSTTYEHYLIARKMADLDFDLVIWVYYLNDPVFEKYNRPVQECGVDDPLQARLARKLRRSNLVDLSADLLGSWNARLRYGFPSNFFAAHEEDAPGFQCARKSLQAAAELFKSRNIQALFAVYPMPMVVGSNYPFRSLHQKMLDIASKDGFTVLDLAPAFDKVSPEQVMLHEWDRHPNGFANRLAADALAEFMRRRGMLAATKHGKESLK